VSRSATRRRASAAARWRPSRVELLLVAEAPPSADDRYFYFEDVREHDALFRHVVQAVLGEKPTRDKPPYLDALREQGVFLIHASEEPFRERREVLPGCLPDLIERASELAPRRVLLVGAPLFDLAYGALREAGLPVLNARLPYPGSGQQRRFLDGFRELVQTPATQEIPR
jgi:hypothetical protein